MYFFNTINIYAIFISYDFMKKILPIAIDLGAKNTGVFSGFYDKGTKLENLSTKQGKVYELSKDSYTLLMDSRTSKKRLR